MTSAPPAPGGQRGINDDESMALDPGSMPRILQNLSLVSPLRYYMDVILGVFLKGAGVMELWPQALALLGIGTILYGASAMAFRAR